MTQVCDNNVDTLVSYYCLSCHKNVFVLTQVTFGTISFLKCMICDMWHSMHLVDGDLSWYLVMWPGVMCHILAGGGWKPSSWVLFPRKFDGRVITFLTCLFTFLHILPLLFCSEIMKIKHLIRMIMNSQSSALAWGVQSYNQQLYCCYYAFYRRVSQGNVKIKPSFLTGELINAS